MHALQDARSLVTTFCVTLFYVTVQSGIHMTGHDLIRSSPNLSGLDQTDNPVDQSELFHTLVQNNTEQTHFSTK